jgi:hypothetical protein
VAAREVTPKVMTAGVAVCTENCAHCPRATGQGEGRRGAGACVMASQALLTPGRRLPARDCGLEADRARLRRPLEAAVWFGHPVAAPSRPGSPARLLSPTGDCRAAGDDLRTLVDLYSVWALRHLHLEGHKLTKIARVAEAYGRTYDKAEEHDAYYLASATLLPRAAIIDAVRNKRSSEEIARQFGTSSELVDYRTKRLGLWRERFTKQIKLARD